MNDALTRRRFLAGAAALGLSAAGLGRFASAQAASTLPPPAAQASTTSSS